MRTVTRLANDSINDVTDVELKQVEHEVIINDLSKQLKSIDTKLDKLINTINENHQYHMEKYNELSERVTILEAEKSNTRYIIGLVGIIVVALEFMLKYVIK